MEKGKIKPESIDKSVLDNWEDFINKHPEGNFFNCKKIFQFFNKLNSHSPGIVYQKDNNHALQSLLFYVIIKEAGLPGFFSSRCIVWGGPLIQNDDKNLFDKVFKEFEYNTSNKVIYTEFRNLFDLSRFRSIFEKFGYHYKPHLNYIVSIEKLQKGERKISSSKKRQINKSVKSGAKIIEPDSLNEIKQFYSILKDLYKNKVKKPLPGFDFFETFYRMPELGKYFLIEYQKRIIGGIMCPVYKDTIYEWYVCGLDGKYKNVYPSVLATWAPIDFAMKNGLKYFDFLGAGSPEDDYGVREFKSKFGGDLVEYGRYIKINKPVMYFVGKVGVKVLGWIRSVF